MLIFLLIRRLSPRARTITGAALAAAGAAVAVVSAVLAVDLYVHAVILFVIGAWLWGAGVAGKRRGRAQQPADTMGGMTSKAAR